MGSRAARGAHPSDARHHELKVKGVELLVCFSPGMLSRLGVGTAEPRCVSSTPGFAHREREARELTKSGT